MSHDDVVVTAWDLDRLATFHDHRGGCRHQREQISRSALSTASTTASASSQAPQDSTASADSAVAAGPRETREACRTRLGETWVCVLQRLCHIHAGIRSDFFVGITPFSAGIGGTQGRYSRPGTTPHASGGGPLRAGGSTDAMWGAPFLGGWGHGRPSRGANCSACRAGTRRPVAPMDADLHGPVIIPRLGDGIGCRTCPGGNRNTRQLSLSRKAPSGRDTFVQPLFAVGGPFLKPGPADAGPPDGRATHDTAVDELSPRYLD